MRRTVNARYRLYCIIEAVAIYCNRSHGPIDILCLIITPDHLHPVQRIHILVISRCRICIFPLKYNFFDFTLLRSEKAKCELS